ncbi:MAG: glycosyltransferase family 4 protein [Bacteroidales bacterium]|nr:glycosyltransferase family 4 protein [Bacteroidales bacterium]
MFDYHCQMLQRYLQHAFTFETKYRDQPYNENDFDLIYPLEFDMVKPEMIKNPQKYVTGIRSHVSWSNLHFLKLVEYLNSNFQAVHVVSNYLYTIFSPYLNNVSYVSHGIDLELFSPQEHANSPIGKLIVGFSGNRKTPIKGFEEYINPIKEIDGVELRISGFSDINLTKNDMPAFYAGLDAIISASSYEGNNNTILEAAAMGCAIVTTAHGTVPEFLINNQSALIIDRDITKIKEAIISLRDNPQKRLSLGNNARKAILAHNWDYAKKAIDFEKFFFDALSGKTKNYGNIKKEIDYQHLCSVIEDQWKIEKELRRGLAGKIFQVTDGEDLLIALEKKNNRIAELENKFKYELRISNFLYKIICKEK